MLNCVNFQGRLVREPALEEKGGFKFCGVTVAWNRKYKEKEEACFLDCKAWGGTAELIAKYFKKGDQIIIEGELRTESWEKDGKKNSKLVCQVSKVDFCGSKTDSAPKTEAKADDTGFIDAVPVPDEELPY